MPVSLDLAALARSLRLPLYALRIVDLSALAPQAREREAGKLSASDSPDLPAQLRMRIEGLVDEHASLDWLVFAPEIPRKAPEKVYGSAIEYWADRLLPPPPVLPAVPAPLRRRLLELDAETWAELRARAAWEGIAPAAMILAALADGLAAWSRDPRFTVELALTGTPLWVPLELDGAALGPFGERARAVQERLRRDLAWPISQASRSLRPDGLPSLPVAVTLPPRLFKDERDERDSRDQGSRRRAEARLLHLQVAEREGGLLLLWDVAEPGFPEGMADALTVGCRDLLRRLSASSAWQEVRRRLIPPQQLARMVAFNTTGAPVPEPYLYELFATRARRQPERIAVTGPSGSATYGELRQTAERLGHLLQREGARRNTPVAVVLEPGREAVAAILGVLAAGAAWLPVDPALPRDQFRPFLEHGRIELAVTREALADALDWPEEILGIMIEDAASQDLPEGPPPVPSVSSASPKDLACVLSGVMLENRGIANLVLDLTQRFAIGPADRTLAHSLSEGTSLFEIFGTLAAGGTVVFGSSEEITVLTAPDRVLLKDVRVAVLRGSLETTVWTAVSENDSSFGRPLSNQSVHILDARLELCPFWVPGDLYVGGLGLARGYWRDPARSAERFTIHPDTGERLFRTGLRARWVTGGEVELLP
ncbi:MAG TPA: AMP-binding protein [Thermoanaerobaculia bacterium]|jgi:yersiniabactin nonribosomal peptide synthetase|nr:AMP-binding protein [Thermoanaerobaculia bacterium]